MTTIYQRRIRSALQREAERRLAPRTSSADTIVAIVGVVGCVAVVALAAVGVL